MLNADLWRHRHVVSAVWRHPHLADADDSDNDEIEMRWYSHIVAHSDQNNGCLTGPGYNTIYIAAKHMYSFKFNVEIFVDVIDRVK